MINTSLFTSLPKNLFVPLKPSSIDEQKERCEKMRELLEQCIIKNRQCDNLFYEYLRVCMIK